jgi:hypothetical protein
VEERNPLFLDSTSHPLTAGFGSKYPKPLISSYELLATCRLGHIDAKHAALDKFIGLALRYWLAF